MNYRIVVFGSGDGGAPEDGNVNYSSYYLLSHATKKFDEPLFTDTGTAFYDPDESDEGIEEFLKQAKELGYTVHDYVNQGGTVTRQVVW